MTTAVIIVAYGHAEDVRQCFRALAACANKAPFDIFIVENGGPRAFSALIAMLAHEGLLLQPCAGPAAPFTKLAGFRQGRGGGSLRCGLARENLGYAGGVNAWLRRLAPDARYDGYWILNPDAQPEPDALAAMISLARRGGFGMVASQIVAAAAPERVASRGQRWRKLVCRPLALDRALFRCERPATNSTTSLDGPSGASFYLTRTALQQIGPMEESYFLYFEDLEWGLRAKFACGLALAEDSVVRHVGGTATGASGGRRARSALSVYLDHRNRLLFVRRCFPRLLAWTCIVTFARAFEFLVVGAPRNFAAALAGWAAGVRGETGRPENFFHHEATP